LEEDSRLDRVVFVGWREGCFDQISCAGNSSFLDGLLQAPTGLMSTYQLADKEFLVGLKRWQEEGMLGVVGGHDKTEVFGWPRFP
jgi:hypothetical protein